MKDTQLRRDGLRKLLIDKRCSAMLITCRSNLRYLTGFTGDDSCLLVTLDGELLLSDPRFEQQISQECPGLNTWIRKPSDQLWEVVCRQLAQRKLPDLVVESAHLAVDVFDRIHEQSQVGRIEKGTVQVETLREIKDADEIQRIRKAVQIAERVFTSVRAQLSEQQTEREIADEIERLARKMGGEGCSFPPIVAVGQRSALPHAGPGQTQIGRHCFVLIDWGVKLDGYCSDLTRVLMGSKLPTEFMQAYETVFTAQKAAIGAIKPGVAASEVDRVARETIIAAGMGERFNHSLGHGIGLDVHEAPRLGMKQDRCLEAGMVVTVEPGVYFPEWGGIRIEDDVLVTETGCEVLSSLATDVERNQVEPLA
jgi:Xaa-Pro aminopeptidase